MNEGLEKFQFFFFFVSKNSLASNMVKLEWQNALYKAANNAVKLIPVKLDDFLMPAILMQTLYIDIYGKGLEFGLRQIVDVINNMNTFTPSDQTYENVRGYIIRNVPDKEIEIEVRAETYLEPMSKYILLVENAKDEVESSCKGVLYPTEENFLTNLDVTDTYKCNGIYYYHSMPTTPGFPLRFTIKATKDVPLKFVGVMRAVAENKIRLIPVI